MFKLSIFKIMSSLIAESPLFFKKNFWFVVLTPIFLVRYGDDASSSALPMGPWFFYAYLLYCIIS